MVSFKNCHHLVVVLVLVEDNDTRSSAKTGSWKNNVLARVLKNAW